MENKTKTQPRSGPIQDSPAQGWQSKPGTVTFLALCPKVLWRFQAVSRTIPSFGVILTFSAAPLAPAPWEMFRDLFQGASTADPSFRVAPQAWFCHSWCGIAESADTKPTAWPEFHPPFPRPATSMSALQASPSSVCHGGGTGSHSTVRIR